jgi:hypothetical protein
MFTDNTNTKKEIIAEVVKISEWLFTHKLGNMCKSNSAWDMYKKDDILDLRDKMLDVIEADIREKLKKNELTDVNPVLNDILEGYNQALSIINANRRCTHESFCENVKALFDKWLGTEGINVKIGNWCTTVETLSTDDGRRSGLDIDFYYRDRYYDLDDPNGDCKGYIEINQPTFGSWNPIAPENAYIRRFFQVINLCCETPQFMNDLAGLYETELENKREYDAANRRIEQSFKADCHFAIREMIEQINF